MRRPRHWWRHGGLLRSDQSQGAGRGGDPRRQGFCGKSGQTPYAGNFMAFNPDWGHKPDIWTNYINKTSEYVNHRYWTETTITESYARYQDLISWGVRFQEGEDGQPVRNPAPPGVTEALRFEGGAQGERVQVLRKQAVKSGVRILDRVLAWTKIKEEQGQMKRIKAPEPKEWWPDLSTAYEERYPFRFPGE